MQELLEFWQLHKSYKRRIKTAFFFLSLEAGLPRSIKLNSKVTVFFVFYTWTIRGKEAFKEAVEMLYSRASTQF